MNGAHLHLVLNHVPVIGIVGCILLLAAALWRRSDELTAVALVACVLVAVVAVPVFLTGEEAEEVVEELDVFPMYIHEHEEWGERSLWAVEILGVAALVMLFWRRRSGHWHRGGVATVLVLALIAAVILGITADQGGEIRHPEVRDDFSVGTE